MIEIAVRDSRELIIQRQKFGGFIELLGKEPCGQAAGAGQKNFDRRSHSQLFNALQHLSKKFHGML